MSDYLSDGTIRALFLALVSAGTILHIAVAGLASLITHKSSTCKNAWMMISLALWFMVLRRMAVSYDMVNEMVHHMPIYYWPEILGVVLSLMLLYGFDALNKCFNEEIHNLIALAEEMPAMVSIMNAGGGAQYVNKKWYEYTGGTPSSSLNHAWHQYIHQDDLAKVWDYWRMCLESVCPYEAKVRVRNKDNEYRWHIVRALPLKDDKGHVHTWFGSMTDVHNFVLDKENLMGK